MDEEGDKSREQICLYLQAAPLFVTIKLPKPQIFPMSAPNLHRQAHVTRFV